MSVPRGSLMLAAALTCGPAVEVLYGLAAWIYYVDMLYGPSVSCVELLCGPALWTSCVDMLCEPAARSSWVNLLCGAMDLLWTCRMDFLCGTAVGPPAASAL